MDLEKPAHIRRTVIYIIFSAVLVCMGLLIARDQSIDAFHNLKSAVADAIDTIAPFSLISPPPVTHIATPPAVRGIYLTSYTAGSTKSMNRIYKLIDQTDINTVVIDIKDYTGRLSYMPKDDSLKQSGAGTKRIPHLGKLIETLHRKNIYVIGRVSAFQDLYLASHHPEYAFTDTMTGATWNDYKGVLWLRPDSQHVWDYTVAIARDAYAQGFDEINVDYVRFPSDGSLKTIDLSTFTNNRSDTIKSFFMYLDTELRQHSAIPLSADLFGLTMSASGDLGIGQNLSAIAPYVDYISPMIYPSHFGRGSYGIEEPAKYPYDIILKSLQDGIAKLGRVGIPTGESTEKLRPWLQDFNLGAVYTPAMIQEQIQATYDAGLDSWLFWDAANQYRELIPQESAQYPLS